MTTNEPSITLYTDSTPNGFKPSIALEELGLPYKVVHVDISTNRQKEPWFLEINPNGRIPALTDASFSDTNKTASDNANQQQQPIRLFEGGSILQYLAERYDDTEHKISFPRGSREHYEQNNWLYFQHGGLGPMQGQANHFYRYAPEKIEYGIRRYINESRRLYRVLDDHLANRKRERSQSQSAFLVGDHISLADIATVGWVSFAPWAGVDLDEFPHVKAWLAMMEARPAVARGLAVPKPADIKSILGDKDKLEAYAKQSSKWIMKGMEDESKN